MAQIIYTLLALFMVMVLTMNMQRGIGRDQQEQSLNEVATQLTGVGTEVLELIGMQHFDRYTFANQSAEPYCGRVAEEEREFRLSHPSSSNFGACSALSDPLNNCGYIEGFEGVDTTLIRGDFEYRVEVLAVEYVVDTSFTTPIPFPPSIPGDPVTSFAKRVQIEVTNPYLYIGDDPNDTDRQFSLTLERVFTYGCTTDYNSIPFERVACPVDRIPSETPCSRWSW